MRVRKLIPISNIIIDREPIGPQTFELAKFLESGGEVPPIHVEPTATGQYKIRDGRHRVLAFKLLGREQILAKYFGEYSCQR